MMGNRDWDDFKTETDKKVVTVNVNGVFAEGKKLYAELDWDLKHFLRSASQRLEISAQRVFNVSGVEIDDCMMIEDNDMLFFSEGEDYINPLDEENEEGTHGAEMKDGEGSSVSSNLPASIGG